MSDFSLGGYDAGPIVKTKFDQMQEYASTAFNRAMSEVAEMLRTARELSPITIDPESFTEGPYQSALMDEVRTRLTYDIENGGNGLDPAVEQDIMDRDKERSELELQEDLARKKREWAKCGAPMPDGVISGIVDETLQKYTDTRLTTSREIAIKSAEWGKDTREKAVASAIELERALIGYQNSIAERLFGTIYKATELALRQVEEINTLRIEAMKSGGQVSAQLAASALASANASASIHTGSSSSKSENESASVSTSVNYNHNFDGV